jgi:hypothetical protein
MGPLEGNAKDDLDVSSVAPAFRYAELRRKACGSCKPSRCPRALSYPYLVAFSGGACGRPFCLFATTPRPAAKPIGPWPLFAQSPSVFWADSFIARALPPFRPPFRPMRARYSLTACSAMCPATAAANSLAFLGSGMLEPLKHLACHSQLSSWHKVIPICSFRESRKRT